MKAKLGDKKKKLADDYGELSLADPDATILVVGYPLIFTAGTHKWCNGVFPVSGFSPKAQRNLDDLALEVDDAIQAAAREANASYVNVTEALKGHALCSAKPWIVDTGAWKNLTDSQEHGHPNEDGQTAIAKIVAESINKAADL